VPQLDVGHPERIVLTSRDGQSCLLVSYRDLKQCVDAAFGDLQERRNAAGPGGA
jgi:PAB-dependent poly(A)-specific ribonuclease subunit 3